MQVACVAPAVLEVVLDLSGPYGTMVRMVPAADDLIDAAEVAAMVPRTTRRTVNRWAREGLLPVAVQTPAGRRYFRRSDIERILSTDATTTEDEDVAS